MVDPLGNQTPRLGQRGLGVVDSIQRGAGLESAHVIRPMAPQIAVRGHHRALAPARIWLKSLPTLHSCLQIARNLSATLD